MFDVERFFCVLVAFIGNHDFFISDALEIIALYTGNCE